MNKQEINTDIDLDTEWIEEFEKYNDLYNDNVENVNVYYMYVSNENNLIDIIKTNTIIINNTMKKEELIYNIKTHMINKNKKYTLLSLIQYNFFIEPTDVIDYLKDQEIHHQQESDHQPYDNIYMTIYKTINNIIWKPTINIFNDLNALYIIYHEKPIKTIKDNITKKIHLSKHKLLKNKISTSHNKTCKKYT